MVYCNDFFNSGHEGHWLLTNVFSHFCDCKFFDVFLFVGFIYRDLASSRYQLNYLYFSQDLFFEGKTMTELITNIIFQDPNQATGSLWVNVLKILNIESCTKHMF